MKGKLSKFTLAFLGILLCSVFIFYLYVCAFYRDGFTYGTWINGVYCTGKDVSTVNNELLDKFNISEVNVFSVYGQESILLSDIDFSVDYTEALNEIYNSEITSLWFLNIFRNRERKDLKPEISFNRFKLADEISKLTVSKETSIERPQVMEIRYKDDEGYYLYSDTTKYINADAFLDLVSKSFYEDFTVTLDDNVLSEREPDVEMKKQKELFEEISPYLETKLIYDFGAEVISIDKSVLSTFYSYSKTTKDFRRDSSGKPYLDEGKALKYIEDLLIPYNTYKEPRDFVTHLGEVKHISFSLYGTTIDIEKEKEYFIDALKNGISETHEPVYIHKAYARGLDDIGNTYIEVDLTNQVLYYIKNGEVKMTCDVVTGKPSAGNATPEMLSTIQKKKEKTYLSGEGYRSYVDYWMAVYKGIGLHDASWQSAFGGDRYLRYGSRGCINMRLEDAKALYEDVEIGVPVIVYK